MSEEIELSNFIENLRSEISKSMKAGEDADLRFKAEKIDLELKVGVTSKKDGSGNLSFKIFGIGAEGGGGGGRSSETMQTVRLTLVPVGRDGKQKEIKDSGDRED